MLYSSTAMMPMVFWASLAPWPRLKSAAETSCRRRNQRSTGPGAARRQTHSTVTMSRAPSAKPISGARTMNRAILSSPGRTRAPNPPLATPAPTRAPTRACETLIGRPTQVHNQVQTIAPTRVASSMGGVMTWESTTPLPMVFATWTPNRKAATKLKKAAHSTASRGDRTRVEITVAIELAASFIPLRKSNSRASATRKITNASMSLAPIRAPARCLRRCRPRPRSSRWPAP